MPKFGSMVRFGGKRPEVNKKYLADETKRILEHNSQVAKTSQDAIKELVDETPGLTTKHLLSKLQGLGFNPNGALLNKMVKDGHLKKRQLDEYWRYYAGNYKFSDEEVGMKKNIPHRAAHMVEHSGEAKSQIITMLRENPGMTFSQIVSALGRGVSLNRYLNQGAIRREKPIAGGAFRYFVGDGERQAPNSLAPSSAYLRVREILKKRPWLTLTQLNSALGRQFGAAYHVERGRLTRVKQGGAFLYAVADEKRPFPVKKSSKIPVDRVDTSSAVDTKPEIKPETPATPAAPSVDIEQLAMRFYWETGSTELRKFIEWFKKQNNN